MKTVRILLTGLILGAPILPSVAQSTDDRHGPEDSRCASKYSRLGRTASSAGLEIQKRMVALDRIKSMALLKSRCGLLMTSWLTGEKDHEVYLRAYEGVAELTGVIHATAKNMKQGSADPDRREIARHAAQAILEIILTYPGNSYMSQSGFLINTYYLVKWSNAKTTLQKMPAEKASASILMGQPAAPEKERESRLVVDDYQQLIRQIEQDLHTNSGS